MSCRVHHRDTCRLCDSRRLTSVLSLPPTPPANAFVVPGTPQARHQEVYPLDVALCGTCGHVQLSDVVSPELLYPDYVYVSGTSPVFVAHFEEMAATIVEDYGVGAGALAVDIGSNDGTLLRFFQRKGCRVLGIDPAREIATRASESGIETRCAFFGESVGREIRDAYGPAAVVTANNVFAHMDDLSGVVRGIKTLLAPDGVFVFEVSYLVDVLKKTLFDTIYHEHLDYHALRPLIGFFERFGMVVVDARRVDTHGGSLRVYARSKAVSDATRSPAAASLIAREEEEGLFSAATYRDFEARIRQVGAELVALLRRLRAEGKRIAGYGAPAKATTLLYTFGIDRSLIEFIIDDSPPKQGLLSPGLHIPVYDSGAIEGHRPDVLVMLAWNFADPIIARHPQFLERGGQFVVPLPEVRIVS